MIFGAGKANDCGDDAKEVCGCFHALKSESGMPEFRPVDASLFELILSINDMFVKLHW